MGRAEQWVSFRPIASACFLVPTVGAIVVVTEAPGAFWEYLGLVVLLDAAVLGLSVYLFGWFSIVDPPAEVEEELEDEDDPRPGSLPGGELTAAQVVEASDRSDGNRPVESAPAEPLT